MYCLILGEQYFDKETLILTSLTNMTYLFCI